mgnify:CR=1 FL=1
MVGGGGDFAGEPVGGSGLVVRVGGVLLSLADCLVVEDRRGGEDILSTGTVPRGVPGGS